jgi:hypothetical protein
MKLIVVFTILQTCLMMRIWVSNIAFCDRILSFQTQALLGLWIQWVQVSGMLPNFAGGVKLGHGPI